ncbi:MAG: hypothetical protein ACOVQ4_18655 [Flectobacillus sp.]|uniref:hypothetical protein n=1 Tax=Flectobacillus sp. TaxID=50419 RepID=UPI003B9CC30D
MLVFVLALLTQCTKDIPLNDSMINSSGNRTSIPSVDSTMFNNELDGKFLYTHLKYYMGSVDLTSYLPKEHQELFKKELESRKERYKQNHTMKLLMILLVKNITLRNLVP